MLKHLCVCICTYKRPEFLKRLLDLVLDQEVEDGFTYEIVVADNDASRSAEQLVTDLASQSSISIRYFCEPRQGIAMARNKAIENATGDFVVFIDDDEFPSKRWLMSLFKVCELYNADGVLGPVMRHFDVEPPEWVRKSSFYVRPAHETGYVLNWRESRTGNVLLKRDLFKPGEPPFKPEFRSNEDQDFFRRMNEQGRRFVWSHEAIVYESVPPIRWNRSFLLRTALLRGACSSLHPDCGAKSIFKSTVAVIAYTVILPVAFVAGHHRFMTVLAKLCNHLGKLLAVIGINPIRGQYITE